MLRTNIACIMMQKNEEEFLETWIKYHMDIFGIENLYIYDNGSNSKTCIDILSSYEKKGLNVVWSLNSKQDFENKGNIIIEKIKKLESDGFYDFYIPMDCDEFIAVELELGGVSSSRKLIQSELCKFKNITPPLGISAQYFNTPLSDELYSRSESVPKTIFAKNTCKSIDIGFHHGETISGEPKKITKIVYIHMHNKPYETFQFFAKQKLLGRVEDFSKDSLLKLQKNKGPGFHLVHPLLIEKEEYYSSFVRRLNDNSQTYYNLSNITSILFSHGLSSSSLNVPRQIINEPSKIWNGHIEHIKIIGSKVIITGWAFSYLFTKKPYLAMKLKDNIIEAELIKLTPRQDVRSIYSSAPINCGVVCHFDVGHHTNHNHLHLDNILFYIGDDRVMYKIKELNQPLKV